MAGKMQDRKFRYPDTAAYLQGLTGEEATKQPPMIRKADGVFTEYWCEGGRVRCRWSKAGANILLAVECRIDDNRQTDFLVWRAFRGAAGRPPKTHMIGL